MSQLIEGIIGLFGALGLFLYAIFRFGDGVQKMTGERLRIIIEKQAQRPLSTLCNGIGIGTALQSNVLTFGMVSSLVNAGLLSLLPALWIMMGVNLGMTVTAQLMAFNAKSLRYIFLFGGYLLYFYGKRLNWHYLGQVLFNLALLYLSFNLFHQSFQTLAVNPGAVGFLRQIILTPWLGFLLGMCIAAAFRSSNTAVIITQSMVGTELALAAQDFLSGVYAIVIGANVGATIINMLLGLDRLPTVRKANRFHLVFNFSTALIWLSLLPCAYLLVLTVCSHLNGYYHTFMLKVFKWGVPALKLSNQWFYIWQIAMAHLLFNLSVILFWFPFTCLATKLGCSIFTKRDKNTGNSSTFLDRRALQSPALALILASYEINHMAAIVQGMLKSARLAFLKGQRHLLDGIYRDEALVDDLQEQITFYLSALLSQNSLTENQSHRLAGMLHIVTDIERVGDHANNIAHLAEKKHKEQLLFSELAFNEIELMFGKVSEVFNKACLAFSEDNLELAKQIINWEDSIDKLEEELRQNHIHRLNQGKCWPGSGVIYVEILSNLQRISAHSANIVSTIVEEGE
ncbi:MAG TPA: Na/Pi cotransporter family protein [Bacillota bacterium]